MVMNDDPDPVRWFEDLGRCRCGRPATGTLRGPRNESYGIACLRCGLRRVALAVEARARAEKKAADA
jgi:hypothetical protein